jgi:3-oxoacyl-[acyl-carrier protein] reductase
MIDLEGKVALVTGASRGIGAATAKLFARTGASVFINYLTEEMGAEEVVSWIRAQGGRASSYKADVANDTEVRKLFGSLLDEFGKLDILVNNAAVWLESPIAELDNDALHKTLKINLEGVFYCCRMAAVIMKQQGGGNIVNVSSTAGQRGEARYSPYAATKGALLSLTRSLAVELAPYGIRVTSVAPGWVDTDMAQSAFASGGRDDIARSIPLGRIATAEQVAGPILFLVSDLANHITGEVINVNGGSVLM